MKNKNITYKEHPWLAKNIWGPFTKKETEDNIRKDTRDGLKVESIEVDKLKEGDHVVLADEFRIEHVFVKRIYRNGISFHKATRGKSKPLTRVNFSDREQWDKENPFLFKVS